MISGEDIKKLGKLSRIRILPEEEDGLCAEVSSILKYIEQIQEVSEGMERKEEISALRNVFREDSDPHERKAFSGDIMKLAPKEEKGYVKVKKIL